MHLDRASRFDTDLIVVGGSTAGLATAIYARLAGWRCTLLEPRLGVLDKACGEGFMPSALALLRELGVQGLKQQPFAGITYCSGERRARRSFPASFGPGAGIRRTDLNAALQQRANSLGVQVRHERLGSFYDDGTGVETNTGLRGRWLVGCDGLRSTVSRQLAAARPRLFVPRFGLRQHWQAKRCPRDVEVYWQDGYEVYVTPLAGDIVNVAVLFTQGPCSIDSCLDTLPQLAANLLTPLNKPLGAGPFEHQSRELKRGRVFLVGDAAGFLDPITGEGNQLAMAASRELISCLAKGRPEAYPGRWRRITRAYWWLTASLLLLRRQTISRQALLASLQRAPALFDLAFYGLSYRTTGSRLAPTAGSLPLATAPQLGGRAST